MNTLPSSPKTVAVCETQPLTAAGIKALLMAVPDLRFGRAGDSLNTAHDMLRTLQPDILLLDKSFGGQAVFQFLGETQGLSSHHRRRGVGCFDHGTRGSTSATGRRSRHPAEDRRRSRCILGMVVLLTSTRSRLVLLRMGERSSF